MSQLGKKTYMTDSLENYQIVMKKHDLQRILGASERPVVIQKRLLEQAGYEERDNIEDVGREDNSYLCDFLSSGKAKLCNWYSRSWVEPSPEIQPRRFIGTKPDYHTYSSLLESIRNNLSESFTQPLPQSSEGLHSILSKPT